MIAGTRALRRRQRACATPAPNDGVVCLDETVLPQVRDHVTMPLSHSGMIVSARATNPDLSLSGAWPFRASLDGSWLLALLTAIAAAAGCSTVGYYFQAVNGQMELARKARPIPEVIADPATEPELKAKLDRIQEMRNFASRELDLARQRQLPPLRRPRTPLRGVERVRRARVFRDAQAVVLSVRRLRRLQGLLQASRRG